MKSCPSEAGFYEASLSSSTPQPAARRLSEVRAADWGEGQRGKWALALSILDLKQPSRMHCQPPARVSPGRRSQATPAAKATLTASLGGCQRLARWRQEKRVTGGRWRRIVL
eukprot:scaffold75280_cov71-Phaeocystis_antarctica.AAC.2